MHAEDGWTHIGAFDAALASVTDAARSVEAAAAALSEDGAQPHLVATLSALERELRQQAERARSATVPPSPAQQALLGVG